MKNDGMIAIYSRKSKFTGKGESIGNQVELCKAYVRNAFGEGDAERCVVFEDEGFSGGNLNRPDFRRMMEEVRKRRFKAVVAYRLDRISRNINDFAGLIEELTRLNVSFVSIREQFDTATPMGRAMMYIISVFSQLERETIAERIRDNMHELAKTGRWLGGNTPTGFTSAGVEKITVDGRMRRSYKLVPLAEEITIPKLIFDLYSQTDSLTAVEAELLRRGVKTKKGKSFTRFAIKGILQNPVYMVADELAYQYFMDREATSCFPKEAFDGTCGILAYNRTRQEKGRTMGLLPVCEWIVAVGQHPGVVPSAQWIRVQESLERNKEKGYRKSRINEALLTGLLCCTCGSRMYPKLGKGRTEGGIMLFSYVCKMKVRSKGTRCDQPNADGNLLDGLIMEHLETLEADPDRCVEQLENFRRDYTDHRDWHETELADLRRKAAENEKISNGLLDALGMTGDSPAKLRMLRRIEELSAENLQLDVRIRELERRRAEGELDDKEFEMMRSKLKSLSRDMTGMRIQEKREAVRDTVQKVVWDGETAHVLLTGADERDGGFPDLKTLWGEDSK